MTASVKYNFYLHLALYLYTYVVIFSLIKSLNMGLWVMCSISTRFLQLDTLHNIFAHLIHSKYWYLFLPPDVTTFSGWCSYWTVEQTLLTRNCSVSSCKCLSQHYYYFVQVINTGTGGLTTACLCLHGHQFSAILKTCPRWSNMTGLI